ncbi:MAG TPA: hypothetical protein VFX59_04405 [Polyangiales bacterium]|nr:hypothetical protein [Polyangiales bacterium]
MNAYSVYGLRLCSALPIPELLEDEDVRHQADVLVSLGEVRPDWLSESYDDADASFIWAERNAERNETVLGFGDVGRYWMRAGHSIVIEPKPDAEHALVRHGLLGQSLAHLLWQRDVFTLHASVLGLSGHHVAFVGVSGEGKSTTAAALTAHGHTLVCDDVAAIQDGQVLPGFPRMRLYEDVLRGVGEEPSEHPQVHSQIEKRSKRVQHFARAPVNLERIFVLATGDSFSAQELPPQEALMELMRHTYCAHQYAPLYGFKQHMERAAQIARAVPVFRLSRPKDLARLPEFVRFVEAQV